MRLTGPLIHEELFYLDREHAARHGELLVHPTAQVAALEAHVFAHVERTALHLVGAQIGDEAIDDVPEARTVEGARADVDVGVLLLCGGRLERSEEHTSELQSRENLVCRLLLEKKKRVIDQPPHIVSRS